MDDDYMFFGVGMPSAEFPTGFQPNDFSQQQINKINYTQLPVCRKHNTDEMLGTITMNTAGEVSGHKFMVGKLDTKGNPIARLSLLTEILTGKLSELSASHGVEAEGDVKNKQIKLLRYPTEVSFVNKGNRDNCKVLAVFPSSKLNSIVKDYIFPILPQEYQAQLLHLYTEPKMDPNTAPKTTEAAQPAATQQQQPQTAAAVPANTTLAQTQQQQQEGLSALLQRVNTEEIAKLPAQDIKMLLEQVALVTEEQKKAAELAKRELEEERKKNEVIRKKQEDEAKKVIANSMDETFKFLKMIGGEEEMAKKYQESLGNLYGKMPLDLAEEHGRLFSEILVNASGKIQPQQVDNWNHLKAHVMGTKAPVSGPSPVSQQQPTSEFARRFIAEAEKLRQSGPSSFSGPVRNNLHDNRFNPMAAAKNETRAEQKITQPPVAQPPAPTSVSIPEPPAGSKLEEFALKAPLQYYHTQTTTPVNPSLLDGIASRFSGTPNLAGRIIGSRRGF